LTAGIICFRFRRLTGAAHQEDARALSERIMFVGRGATMRTRAYGFGRCLLLVALLAWPGVLTAQQSFRISGTVVDATTQRPLQSVQVALVGTS
jgi:hypothetical protein